MAALSSISPFFIVTDLAESISFYRKLKFEVKYSAPPEDPFFAIVSRDNVSIMLKEINPDILPLPNSERHEWARWDAFIFVEDPDSLYEELQQSDVRFYRALQNDEDGLRGFEIADADGYVLFFGKPAPKA